MKKKLANIGLAAILVIAVFAAMTGIASAEITTYNETGKYIEGTNVSVNTSGDFNRSYINVPLTFQINNTLNDSATSFNVTNHPGLTTNATDSMVNDSWFWVNASSEDTYWVNVSNSENQSEYVNFTVEYSPPEVKYIEGINVSVNTSDAFNRSYINVPLMFQINNTLNGSATNFSVDTQSGLTTNATGSMANDSWFWVNASIEDTYWVNVSNSENQSEYVNFTVEYSSQPSPLQDITTITIEIKPETLNLASKGVFTAFIQLPKGYDVANINISTVVCEGVPAVKGMVADDNKYIAKFDREDLVGVEPGDAVPLTVTGKLYNETPFEGNDTIRVIKRGRWGLKLLPDHPIYKVKRWSEGVHMFFTFNDTAKARLHIHFSEKRLAEAKAMTELGKTEWSEGLMEDYIRELNETYMCMQRQKQKGKPVTDLAEHVCNATDEQAEILSDLVDEVPEHAKLHMEHAMNASYRGHMQALEEIEEEKPERAAQLCAEFAEKRMERAVEMIEVGKLEHAQRMLQRYNESVEEAEKAMKIAEKRGLNVTEWQERLKEMPTNVTQKRLQRIAEEYNKKERGRIVGEAGTPEKKRGQR
jgi:hypothetical protein